MVARIACIVVLVISVLLFILTGFFSYCENNPLDFIAGTRIHPVRPRIYDANFNSGSLVLVRSVPVTTLESGSLISMVYNNEMPLIYNNERFVEYQEEFYGISLHGIVTERTLERNRLPLRAGRYVGVPFGSIPLLGAILVWTASNFILFTTIVIILSASAITALVFLRRKRSSDVVFNPKKKR